MRLKYGLLASSALLAAAFSTSAFAQQSGGNVIEELVVTAEKREQSLQDVPVAVSAFTSEKRDLVGINTIADITNFTPGLEYNAQNDRNTLRGVGRNTNVHAAEGSVAQYSDGIYTSSTILTRNSPLFLDRVEVLRGPQGTLYGKNAIGGAINFISKRPTEEFYAEVRAKYGNYNAMSIEAATSGPTMIEGVKFRLGASLDRQTKGWFKNTVPGFPDEGNIINNKYIEGQLKFDFNENFEGWVRLSWFEWQNEGGGPGSRNAWTPFKFPTYESVNAGSVSTSGYACRANTGVTNVVTVGGMTLADACTNAAVSDARKFTSAVPYTVKLTGTITLASEWIYHANNFDVKYVFGGTHYHYRLGGPTPVDQAPIASYTLPRVLPPALTGQPNALVTPGAGPTVKNRYHFSYEEVENWWSHEVNITSTHDGPFQWLVGAYYYDADYKQPVSTSLVDQQVGPNFLTNAVCARTGGVCPALPTSQVKIYDDQPELDIQARAVFAQIDWEFADTWKATLGLRYTEDHKSGKESLRVLCFNVAGCGAPPELVGNFVVDLTQLPTVVSYGTAGALPPGVSSLTTVDPASGYATRHYNNSWDAVTGTAGIQWEPDADTNAYFRYSRGYKAGGFRIGIDTVIGAFPNTDKETADSFEFGLKKNFGSRFQANIAGFYYEYKNAQIPITVAQTSGGLGQAQSIFYNIPKSVSQGFEVETIWQPIDNLQFLFNYSYLDAHVKSGNGVVDPADPAALDADADPIISQAQCIAAAATPSTADNCSTDVFTTGVPNGGFQRGQDLSGQDLPHAPRHKVAFNANYTWEMDAGSLVASASYIWRDKQYGSIFNRDHYKAPAWDQVDARLAWKDRDDRFTIIASVKNLFDDIGYAGGATAARRAGFVPGYVLGLTGAASAAATPVVEGIASTYFINPPRTYGIELQYRF